MSAFIVTSDGRVGFSREEYINHFCDEDFIQMELTLRDLENRSLFDPNSTRTLRISFPSRDALMKAGGEIRDQLSSLK